MPTTTPVVLLGADWIPGLQTARILHRRGIPVIGCVTDPATFAARSRAYREVHRLDPTAPNAVDALLRIASDLPERPVLIPCNDQAVLAIARHREHLDVAYRIVLPSLEVVQTLMSKASFAEHAKREGLPVPTTLLIDEGADAADATGALPFPWVVKPALKSSAWGRAAGGKVAIVQSPEEWLALYERVRPHSDTMVVQELIGGPARDLYSCNLFIDRRGRPHGTFVARKLRQWPLDTGDSASGEAVVNDAVRELAVRLFTSLPYTGLGYVEVKHDRSSDRLVLIEANVGRPTGRSAIAEAGGVDLLGAVYLEALDEPLPPAPTQPDAPLRWVYLRHDLQAAVVARRRGDLTWWDWWRSLRRPRIFAVWDRRDPLPFVVDLVRSVQEASGRRRSGSVSDGDDPRPITEEASEQDGSAARRIRGSSPTPDAIAETTRNG